MKQKVISRQISQVLRNNRDAIAVALVDSVAHWEKYSEEIANDASRYDFSQRETVVFVDYLISYFETGDSIYRDLYIGEKLKQCYSGDEAPAEAVARRRDIIDSDQQAILSFTNAELDSQSSEVFAAELSFVREVLTHRAETLCNVLLVGDCLYLDLLGFLSVPLMQAGIWLVPTFITNKIISGQHRELQELQAKDFDIIFYSPLSFSFHTEFSEFQFVRTLFRRPSHRKGLIKAAKRDIKATVDLLGNIFRCPIFVHNAANLRRHDGSLLEFSKTLLTRRARSIARSDINAWISKYLKDLGSNSRNLFLLDETTPLRTISEWRLSKTLYNAALQHPAYFGRELAPLYEDILIVQLLLSKKKLIVCDLDNTLWKGTIGDGPVEHFVERQNILQELRKKGLLLAISSKNDPKNVTWRGGVLSNDDFICQHINWDSKSKNILRIALKLNLKVKDFIFIDDRADERALAATSMPELTVLDAELSRTWSQLALLAITLQENVEGDRTLTYRQREERRIFLDESLELLREAKLDESEALKKLNLELEIRFARRRELGRVAELVNRTNQFNMTGGRTNLQEVNRWHESDKHTIWVAEARDKFGSMGTISVTVIEKTPRGLEILLFVLSCRVFGYGMENAVLNRIKQWAPDTPIFGHFKETPHNGPCHQTYPNNNFSREGAVWVFREGKPVPDAKWLSVKEVSN